MSVATVVGDMWHAKRTRFFSFFFNFSLGVLLLVLLFAHIERFSDSRMQVYPITATSFPLHCLWEKKTLSVIWFGCYNHNKEWVNLSKREGMNRVFRGLAGLLWGISRGQSPREIPMSSPASPRIAPSFPTLLLRFTFYFQNGFSKYWGQQASKFF